MKLTSGEVMVCGILFDVEYYDYPPSRGHRDCYGCPYEPDEAGGIELQSIKIGTVEVYDVLSDKVIEKIEQQLYEDASEDAIDYLVSQAEWRRDEERERLAMGE